MILANTILKKIQIINENGTLVTNHKKIANTFNMFVCDGPKQIENKIVETHKNYQDYLLNPIENTFNLDPTSTEVVHSYIKIIRNSKRTGPSSMPNNLLKQSKKPLSETLKLLINLIFPDGKFRAILKMGKTMPLYDKGCKLN